jgi:curved DNA-binding protein CbpA
VNLKDYYKILGVDHAESLEGIHTAYRRLAKQCHPNLAGVHSKEKFQGIQEEYEVLSDPDKRKDYDAAICFICSFGAADVSSYEVIGTKGHLQLNPAFEYVGSLEQRLTLNGHTRTKRFPAGDQFAAELIYFSDCIHRNRDPEPFGIEGLIDVHIIQALYRSWTQRKPVKLNLPAKSSWPTNNKRFIGRPFASRNLFT